MFISSTEYRNTGVNRSDVGLSYDYWLCLIMRQYRLKRLSICVNAQVDRVVGRDLADIRAACSDIELEELHIGPDLGSISWTLSCILAGFLIRFSSRIRRLYVSRPSPGSRSLEDNASPATSTETRRTIVTSMFTTLQQKLALTHLGLTDISLDQCGDTFAKHVDLGSLVHLGIVRCDGRSQLLAP